jgi:mycothiol synthase
MKNQLPNGFAVRPPTMDDAQAVTNLVAAADMDEFGKVEYGINDLLPMWQRKNFDLARDARMIFAPDGTLAGYCDMNYRHGVTQLDNISCAHPAYKNRGIEDWILEFAEDWAQEHVTEGPIILRHVLNADAFVRTARMERWGYHAVRNAWIMYIELTQKPPEPIVAPGITIRSFRRGQDERAAWACIQETFRDLWQHQDSPFDEWASFILGHASWSPELSYLAFDGEELVGATITMNDELGGWVQQVGVRRPWRGRGIGLALLHSIFGDLYKLGVTHAGLEVDAENPSGALNLYKRAGMRVDKHFTEYRKELRVPVPVPA